MANRYWIGGTGNWSDTAHWSTASGGAGGASVPTSVDNAYFNASSFTAAGQTVTVDALAICNDMDWTGVTNTPSLSTTALNALNIYGNLILVSGMNITGAYGGYILFKGTTTGKTITTAGKSLYYLNFMSNGSWTLLDNLTVSYYLILQYGTLNTNNKNITCGTLQISDNTQPKTLNLGSSVVTINANIYLEQMSLTFNCGTSTFVFISDTSLTMYSSGLTFYDVEFRGNTSINSTSNTFHKIKLAASKTLTLFGSTTTTVADLDIGNNATITASSSANLVYSGTASPTNMGTGVTKTNIVVTAPSAPANKRYWVGGTGNWSDTNHWSALSGFFGGFSVPSNLDDVYFNTNSFDGTGEKVIVDVNTMCKNLNWTGAGYSPTFENTGGYTQTVYGDLVLTANVTMSGIYAGNFIFYQSSNNTITTAGRTCYCFQINGVSTMTLQDNVTLTGTFSHSNGILNTNSKSISCYNFSCYGTTARTLTLGTSIITCTNNFTLSGSNITATTSSASIIMSGASSTSFDGFNFPFYNLTFLGSSTITGSNTFNKITLAASKTLVLTDSTTTTVTDLDIGNSATISATTSANLVYNGTTAPTNMGTGVTKTNIVVTTPNAPANKRYWVGNSGNWSDTNHWSVLSGFFGGFSVPTSTDSVYFDSDSFTTTGQTVTVDLSSANCLSMDWTGALNNPTFTNSGSSYLYIFGDLTFIHDMTVNGSTTITMKATDSRQIKTNGVIVSWYTAFNSSTGTWSLQDDYIMSGDSRDFAVYNGTFITNGYNITAPYNIGITSNAIFYAGNSTLSTGWFVCQSNKFYAQTSTINLITTYEYSFQVPDNSYFYTVKLEGTGSIDSNYMLFYNSNAHIKNLFIEPGRKLKITSGKTITVDYLNAMGTSALPITIISSSAGSRAILSCSNSDVYVKYCNIQDITALGNFNAIKSTNVSGNTGWTFADSIKIGELLPATVTNAGLLSYNDKKLINQLITVQGGTMQGPLIMKTDTDYSTPQIRNIIISDADADVSLIRNGEIWLKYT